MLYADSPIDSSLFSLYIHQNYTQFCNEIEESEGIADWLSWVDSSGGEAVCSFFSFFSSETKIHFFSLLSVVSSQPSPIPSNNIRNSAFTSISSHKTVPEKLQTRVFRLSPERKGCLEWCTCYQRLDCRN